LESYIVTSKLSSCLAVGAAAIVIVVGTAGANEPAASVGDPARGKTLYQACSACHTIDENDIGPRHRGVVGRHAGSLADYAYSPALKNSGVVWNDTTLDQWLTNPSALVPGTKMFFKLDDPQMRADVIAYLKQLK
jgi:cytochrome c